MPFRPIFAALALLALAPAAEASSPAPRLEVHDAWSRPTAMAMGVGYLTVQNRGPAEDRLTGASSPLAASVTLHRTVQRGGVSSMQLVVEGLPVPPGGTVRLEPGGYHLMLMGLKHPLQPGERVPLTLDFQHAGRVAAALEVRTTPPR